MTRLGSAEWVGSVLTKDGDATIAELVTDDVIRLQREQRTPALVGAISVPRVTEPHIRKFTVASNHRPSFVVNIPSEAVWKGDAIDALASASAAFGGMGDLRRALRLDDPGSYVFREFEYVERRLWQTGMTTKLTRQYDRVWEVSRKVGPSISVAITNAYDLTADVVRTMYQRCAPFDVLFHTNSLGQVTREAYRAAAELGIEIVHSDGLLERLRRQ